MRTLLAPVLATAAGYAILVIAVVLSDDGAGRSPAAHPVRFPPWRGVAGWLSASAVPGGLGILLLNRGTLGRMVRGRGIFPAEQ